MTHTHIHTHTWQSESRTAPLQRGAGRGGYQLVKSLSKLGQSQSEIGHQLVKNRSKAQNQIFVRQNRSAGEGKKRPWMSFVSLIIASDISSIISLEDCNGRAEDESVIRRVFYVLSCCITLYYAFIILSFSSSLATRVVNGNVDPKASVRELLLRYFDITPFRLPWSCKITGGSLVLRA